MNTAHTLKLRTLMMTSKFVLESENHIEFLRDAFPDIEFNLYQATVSESSFLSVVSVCVGDEKTLERLWSRINNLVGTEYLPKLNDFSSWNMYLAFITPNKLSNALKYMIENDTFFVRKIVFDNHSKKIDKEHITTYLDDHILSADIKVAQNSNQAVINEQKYSSITKCLLSTNLPLGRTIADKKIRDSWLDKLLLEVEKYEI